MISTLLRCHFEDFELIDAMVFFIINDYLCSVDSIMLVENGFEVVSVDASDKMLKYALKERWTRRKETGFDNWGTIHYILREYKAAP